MENIMGTDHFPTAYGFACGYVKRVSLSNMDITIWHEHEVYHVRGHEFDGRGRLFWDSFRTLGQAKKAFLARCAEYKVCF